MIASFTTEKIGRFASVQGGYAFKSDDFVNFGIPVLKIKNVRLREVDTTELAYVSSDVAEAAARYYCKFGDLLISMTGSGPQAPNSVVGRTARFTGPNDTYLINQRVGRIVLKDSRRLDARYLFYILTHPEYQWRLVSIATGSANQANISGAQIENLEIPVPPLKDQRTIAKILGTLDDKVELNRKMNQTLEAMARAIFKSWFVDFDPVRAKAEGRDPGLPADIAALFPDSFEDSEVGEIPKGWSIRLFSEIVQIIGGGTPKTTVAEYWGADIPWFSVVDAPADSDVFVINTDKTISQAGLDNSAARLLPVGATIISARGTVGKVALVGVSMAMNQSCYGLRGIEAGPAFTYFATRTLVSLLQQHGHGSVFNTITRDTLAGVSSIAPPEAVLDAFEPVVAPFLQRIKCNLLESRTLAAMRDALLPKLLSGEIRVKDAEKKESTD